jgi:predicted amidohydrolase YtcJ
MRLILRNTEVAGRLSDVTVSGCEATVFDGAYVDDDVLEVDAFGGVLLPGLHDHHLHLLSMAVASVDCSTTATLADLGAQLRQAPGEWVRATGYHESIGGDLDRHVLDRLTPDRPVRMQHRSGALWILNSRALQEVAAALDDSDDVERDARGVPNGRLWRYDTRLRAALPAIEPDLAAVGDRLLRLGITGVTDATPDLDAVAIALLRDARITRALPQDLMLLGAPDGFVDSAELTAGPAKLLLRDHDLPDVDAVAAWVAARHTARRPVAIHCVTSEALAIVVAALDAVGACAGDRIEHAAVVPPGMRADIARLGIRVVTNPGFLHERGDTYAEDVLPAELPFLYPHRSLIQAGVTVAVASDAPFGNPDPWAVVRAATHRTTLGGRVLSPDETVTPWTALAGYLSAAATPGGAIETLTVGRRGGLCLLRLPRLDMLAEPDADLVRLVATGGLIEAIDPAAGQPVPQLGTSHDALK